MEVDDHILCHIRISFARRYVGNRGGISQYRPSLKQVLEEYLSNLPNERSIGHGDDLGYYTRVQNYRAVLVNQYYGGYHYYCLQEPVRYMQKNYHYKRLFLQQYLA